MKIIILALSIFLLTSCSTREEQENYCENKGMILYDFRSERDLENTICETKYEKCLRNIRYTFSDLADTWGTISKTMSSEMDRCLKNIDPNSK